MARVGGVGLGEEPHPPDSATAAKSPRIGAQLRADSVMVRIPSPMPLIVPKTPPKEGAQSGARRRPSPAPDYSSWPAEVDLSPRETANAKYRKSPGIG